MLPVGGIKESVLAAKSNNKGNNFIGRNRKDVEDIKEIYKGTEVPLCRHLMEVLDIALLKQKVNNAKKITFE